LFEVYIDTALEAYPTKCKRIKLKIEHNCYVHTLHFADDEVVINSGLEELITQGKLGEGYEKWRLKINYRNPEF
jgi:hypothetical protein